MSTNLYWRPVPKDYPGHNLDQLKFILGPRFWDHDGSLPGDPIELDEEYIGYLRGLVDAGSETVATEAQELIDAIKKYGVVELTIR